MNTQIQETLKMTIEQLEAEIFPPLNKAFVIAKLKEALEQPAQEPVAWLEVIDHYGHKISRINLFDKGLELADGTNLYIHPAHPWQELTDDDFHKSHDVEFRRGAAWAEQILEERNHG
jgi:hypothetical protein